MTKPCIILVLTFAAFITAYGQKKSVKANNNASLTEKLTKLEFTLNELLAKRNFATYATYLADDYVRISANGQMKNKQEVLAEFEASPSPSPTVAIPEVRQIRIYGKVAVMHIHLTTTQDVTGHKSSRESLLTKIFIQRNDRWYLVSLQGTPLVGR